MVEITDALGRRICVRPLSPLEQLKLTTLASFGPTFFQICALASALTREIDGKRIGFPVSKKDVDQTTVLLGPDGVEAISLALSDGTVRST